MSTPSDCSEHHAEPQMLGCQCIITQDLFYSFIALKTIHIPLGGSSLDYHSELPALCGCKNHMMNSLCIDACLSLLPAEVCRSVPAGLGHNYWNFSACALHLMLVSVSVDSPQAVQ